MEKNGQAFPKKINIIEECIAFKLVLKNSWNMDFWINFRKDIFCSFLSCSDIPWPLVSGHSRSQAAAASWPIRMNLKIRLVCPRVLVYCMVWNLQKIGCVPGYLKCSPKFICSHVQSSHTKNCQNFWELDVYLDKTCIVTNCIPYFHH